MRILTILILQHIQTPTTQANSALLKSVFVEDLDLLVVSSEDSNICESFNISIMYKTQLTSIIHPLENVFVYSFATK